MTKLRILHLTDFHYTENKTSIPIQNRLIDSLSKTLKKDSSEVDFIFFTGDIVDKGNELDHFFTAEKNLLDRLSNELKVPKTNVIICAGNHDVNRGQELDDIASSIKDIKNNEELNKYITKQEGKSLNASLENFNNYFKFHDSFYKKHSSDFNDYIDKMYSIHKREKGGNKISISTINSAWRAIDSKTDSGNLLYPTHLLKESYEKIKQEKSFNIILMHHPLSDFKYWNSQSLESIIFKDYHIMFSGHTHKNRDTIHVVPEIGMYSCTSNATLSLDGESKIGYSIVEIDLSNYDLKIINEVYDLEENTFYTGEPKLARIPVSEEKIKENKFRETIRKRFNLELEKANELFLSNKEQRKGDDFIHLFTSPIIKDKPKNLDDTKSNAKNFVLDNFLTSKENEILFGRNKSGKTAILYKVLLDSLNSFSSTGTIPLYINCMDYLRSNKPINIAKLLARFYELNSTNATNLSKDYHIKILLDNFNEHESFIIKPLNDFLSTNKNSSVLAVAEETLFNSFSNQSINNSKLSNRFIWEIGRTQIRTLTNKWPNLTDSNREILLEKIHKVFNQLNIPSNYWTVSLFIWIFEKNADANFRNNFQLIELYIDNLLGRDNFIINESSYKIDYDDFKSFLGDLSYYLVTDKKDNNYALSYAQLIEFIDKYKQQNRKFVIGIDKITNLILEIGLLKKVDEDNYTFRLNGVFEYFLALYMKDNKKFRDEIIDDGHFFLSFANEFEICAGFNSRDTDFITKIYAKTKEIFSPISSKFNPNEIDHHLLIDIEKKLNIDLRLSDVLKEKVKPIPLEEQDVIFSGILDDNQKMSGVIPKKYYESIEINSENLEKSLLILARVFRNSKFKNQDLEDEIFDFILNSTCFLGFQLMNEIEENKLGIISESTNEDELMKMLIQFVPITIQTFFYDAVVQNNLENIIIDKIEKLKENEEKEQLKLLILYFSLIDLNLKNNNKYIKEVIDILKIGVLKQTSLIKLYIYLATKVNGNENLRRTIESHIKNQSLSIDSSNNVGEIEKSFSGIKKNKLIKSRK
ncbi:metallophosphoesterase [Tenacibaculum maritimum]|uniref:metallophosphoesterase n=1 Tax=Tenacibaculum maritimum TaxID=107401 RepID=UPI00388D48C5